MKTTLFTVCSLAFATLGCSFTTFGQAAQTTPSGTLIANQNANAAMPASAILELRSNNKGMLPPRMTTAQMNAIASPTAGLMVFDTDAKCLKTYNGTTWECANANIVATTPLSSSFAFKSVSDNYVVSQAIVADNTGSNTISVGSFRGSVTFGNSTNNRTLTSLGAYDGFIVKHDSNGNLIWATQIGGATGDQEIYDVAIDNSGNIAVTGHLRYSTSFYSTNGGESSYTNNGSYSKIFVAKYTPSGVLTWFKVVSSSGNYDCSGRGVSFDSGGNVVSTGMYRGIAAFDAVNLTSISNTEDIFIAKLNANNGSFQWVRTAGGNSNTEAGHEIVCDASNNVYILGFYTGTSTFGEAPSSINYTSRGLDDIFIMKYSDTGVFSWAKTAGSTDDELMGGIAYSPTTNSIYICGSYNYTLSFGSGLGTNPLSSIGTTGYYNGFVAKYDLNGNVIWATKQGNTGSDHNYNRDIDVDATGNPYVCGEIEYNSRIYSANNTTDFFYLRGVENSEPVVMKYNSSGTLLWAVCAVDGNIEVVRGISIKNNTAFVFGNFAQTINFGYQQLTAVNASYNGDLFIWRYAE